MMKFRLLIIFVSAAVFVAAAPAARAWWLVDQFGGLTEFGPEGQVLGEGSGRDSGGEERKTEQKRDGLEIRQGEIRQGENRIRMERKDGEVRMKIKNEATGEERELEIKREAGEKMKFREKTEFEEPENEAPEMEMEKEEELLRIREREDKNEIRVGSDSGSFIIKRNRVGAVSDFPLSIDLSTNTLSVKTPAGEKQVTVLPDQAVQNMLSRNVIDQIGGQTAGDLTTRVKMSQKSDGTLIYEVEGEKQERLFGLVPLKFKKTAVVSAETGELLETKATLTNKILEFLSF